MLISILQYYVHIWDFATSIPELMQSLNHLVQQRKVLYLGVSDTPAWVVAQANAYARQFGLRPFSVYQGRWSAAERDFERDVSSCTRIADSWGPIYHSEINSPSFQMGCP